MTPDELNTLIANPRSWCITDEDLADLDAKSSKMPNAHRYGPSVQFRLTPDEQAALEAHHTYTPREKGRSSGHSAAVRAILREHLGLPPAEDPHARQSVERKGKPNMYRKKADS